MAQTVTGSKMGATRPMTDIPKLIDLYKDGKLLLDELVTKTYPLDEINEAFASVNKGEALRNVIVF
jgi:S-(hydroxymethyl)glutathione dehydrogenase/alcohol dehydrogenase